jgi:hypothetical protein
MHDHYRYEIIFSTFASAKRKQNRIRLKKNMRNTSPAAPTIRFRRWSRKAYAAFASIGRCVTIGCLRKSVADSSLSKQKTAGTAGHAGCGEESTWKGETEGRETDTGIPLGSSSALTSILTEPGTNRHILFETQFIRPCGNTGGQDTYSLKQKRTRGTDYRKPCSRMTSCTAPAIRTSVFIHEHNPRKI